MTLEVAERAKEILQKIEELEEFKDKLNRAKELRLSVDYVDQNGGIKTRLIKQPNQLSYNFDIREHLISDIDLDIGNLKYELEQL